jgi:hypothetical protein
LEWPTINFANDPTKLPILSNEKIREQYEGTKWIDENTKIVYEEP